MSGYTGLAIGLGAAALAAKLGLTRYRGPVKKDDYASISVPSLTVTDIIRDSCGPWDSRHREEVVAASRGLLGQGIRRDIVIHPADWLASSNPRSDQAFHVYVGTARSSPAGRQMITPRVVAGIECPTPLGARAPIWNGYVIKDDLGYPIAEYTPNNLRLLVDADPAGCLVSRNVYVRILSLAVHAIASNEDLGKKPPATFLTEVEADTILGNPNTSGNLRKLQQQLGDHRQEVFTLQGDLEAVNSELDVLNAQNLVFTQLSENRHAKIKGIREKILQVPLVHAVETSSSALTVFTDRLQAKDPSDPGVQYDLGEFKITIYLDGRNGGIVAKNLTRTPRATDGGIWNAPHVEGSGRMLLEGGEEVLLSLLADHDYPKLVKFVIKHITNPPATASAVSNLRLFPQVR